MRHGSGLWPSHLRENCTRVVLHQESNARSHDMFEMDQLSGARDHNPDLPCQALGTLAGIKIISSDTNDRRRRCSMFKYAPAISTCAAPDYGTEPCSTCKWAHEVGWQGIPNNGSSQCQLLRFVVSTCCITEGSGAQKSTVNRTREGDAGGLERNEWRSHRSRRYQRRSPFALWTGMSCRFGRDHACTCSPQGRLDH